MQIQFVCVSTEICQPPYYVIPGLVFMCRLILAFIQNLAPSGICCISDQSVLFLLSVNFSY